MSYWRERAKRLIAKLTADLPEDAPLAVRKKALHGKGWPAHEGTNWGRKMWGSEVRKYLARYGAPLGARAGKPGFKWPADIAFPFREKAE